MSQDQSSRPGLLANLILMLIVGAALFAFLAYIKGFGKGGDKPVVAKEEVKPDKPLPTTPPSKPQPTPEKPKLSPEDQAKKVAQANEVRPKSGPVMADPAERERARQLLMDTGPRKPFSNVPPEFQAPQTPAQPTMPAAPGTPTTGDTTPPPATGQPTTPGTPNAPMDAPPAAPEPVREVAAASPEGAALLSDASARIEEAPAELYSDKAKAKVREGLKSAKRIFKVHTVYFEKGGAITQDKDVDQLTKALEAQPLQDAMSDPRAVFFVLGFADKSGAADTNKKLSTSRADAVIGLLRDKCGVLNLTYPVAVGSTEIVAPENKEKNRAAEVWLVLP